MGLANLSKKLVNEFYSGLIMHADEYENPVRFKSDNLYTFIDGQERVITESDLGKLIGCEFMMDLLNFLVLILLKMFGIPCLVSLVVRRRLQI